MFVGIDVGGERKGFHVAIAEDGRVTRLFRCVRPEELLRELAGTEAIAIDAPRRATIVGSNTRLAERELHQAGFRIQWTRREPAEPQAWMLNGQALWDVLLAALPEVKIIETFPTAAWCNLDQSALAVGLSDFAGTDRATRGDFLDAIVAADVAARYRAGTAIAFGLDDELNPIWT